MTNAELNKIKGLVVGQFGESVSLTVVDKNGSAVDISSYTTSLQVVLRDPLTLKTLTYSDASFYSDGTDGKVVFTPASGDIDRSGEWEGQIKLEKSTGVALTRVFIVYVDKRLGVST